MKAKSVSLISTLANLILAITKLVVGSIIGSLALTADGVHSGLDVFSSLITFWGIRLREKPADEKHPYGFWRAESLAGFLVTIFLIISAFWIIYESIGRFFGQKPIHLSFWALIVIAASFIFAELLARLKFFYGRKYKSIALVADAEHSRADALSSLAVLIGVVLSSYFEIADALVALGVGIYILYQAFEIGKEVTDSLLDVANKDVEKRIRKICQAHNLRISDLKTRKIGSYNLAEIKIKLPPDLKIKEAQEYLDTLEERLLKNIPELKQIIISLESYEELNKNIILPWFGKKIGEKEEFEKIGPPKQGKRFIVPLEKDEKNIAACLGSQKYFLIDRKQGKTILKQVIENPYFKKEAPYGTRFAKAIRADKVFTKQIGENARKSLENWGLDTELIPQEMDLENLLKKIEEES